MGRSDPCQHVGVADVFAVLEQRGAQLEADRQSGGGVALVCAGGEVQRRDRGVRPGVGAHVGEVVDPELVGECRSLHEHGVDGEWRAVDPFERPRPHDNFRRLGHRTHVAYHPFQSHMGERAGDVGVHLDGLHPHSLARRVRRL